MGKSSKKATQPVTDYHMTIHYGVCQGPVDILSQIRINEKVAWTGFVGTTSAFSINQPGLFGGAKKEGGAVGDVYWQVGDFTQVQHEYVAARYGLTAAQMTGYRGIATACFTHPTNFYGGRVGFLWGSNNPFIPPVDFKVTRLSDDWQPSIAPIYTVGIGSTSIVLSLDNSASMLTGSRLATLKTAMGIVFDDIRAAISNGVTIDIALNIWSGPVETTTTTYTSATTGNINTLESLVNSMAADGDGTYFDEAADAADTFFSTRPAGYTDRRAWVFVTDGVPDPAGTDDDAVAIAAGLISGANAVNIYGVNIEETSTLATGKLDNTPADGVPIVSSTDTSGLVQAVRQALYGTVEVQSNPAHIIREVLTNKVWGMGADTSVIDDTSFLAAATTLFNESFGLSLMWAEQSTIEDFVQEILDHIEATLYIDPASGKFVLKLIRNDYTLASMPLFDETNCEVVSFTRRSPAEIINEIVVSYTDPYNQTEPTVTLQDLAGVVRVGGEIISDSRNYYGVRSPTLAWRLAQRDLTAATAPLATVEIECNRDAWDLNPGEVFRLTDAENGANELAMRVVKVDPGRPGDASVKVNATQDIFAQPQPLYDPVDDPEPPTTDPYPTDFDNVTPITMNYFLSAQFLDPSIAASAVDPDAGIMVLTDTTNTGALSYELYGELTDAAGTTTIGPLGTLSVVTTGTLQSAWVSENSTTETDFGTLTTGNGVATSGYVMIGDNEATAELGFVQSYDSGTGTWTILRGLMDTVPRAWPAGTKVRFFSTAQSLVDAEVRSEAEVLDYYALMDTGQGQLAIGAATLHQYTALNRSWRPTRPADVEIDGIGFGGQVDMKGAASVDITWANRNRLTEDSVLQQWTAANVTPETNQITRIRVVNADTLTTITTINTLEGATSQALTPADFSGEERGLVRVWSERDGDESFQYYEALVYVDGGFGQDFGNNFGSPA